MPEINNNPSIIYPIVPVPTSVPVPVITPVQRPMPEPEMEAEDQDVEQDMGEGEAESEAEEPEAPRKKVADDGISDLFEGLDLEAETDDIDDLFSVTEEDIMGDEDSSLSDLTKVKREDIMGRRPKAKRMSRPPRRRSGGGMQGVGY